MNMLSSKNRLWIKHSRHYFIGVVVAIAVDPELMSEFVGCCETVILDPGIAKGYRSESSKRAGERDIPVIIDKYRTVICTEVIDR